MVAPNSITKSSSAYRPKSPDWGRYATDKRKTTEQLELHQKLEIASPPFVLAFVRCTTKYIEIRFFYSKAVSDKAQKG
jgi:hypothetical protein